MLRCIQFFFLLKLIISQSWCIPISWTSTGVWVQQGEKPTEEPHGAAAAGPVRPVPPPLLPERGQWTEREREMERRERTRAEREWDRDKVKDFSKPGEEREAGARRSRSRDRERRRKERGKSKERKTDKKGEKFESHQFVLCALGVNICIITTTICSLY